MSWKDSPRAEHSNIYSATSPQERRDSFTKIGEEASQKKAFEGDEKSEQCAACGAVLPAGSTCQTIFDEFLSLEYTNPAYGQVHFLTVACFMIQHGCYSDEGLRWIQSTLRTYLEHQLTGQQLRQLAAKGTDGATRTWKVTRQPDEPPLPKVAWSMTITDVAHYMQDAESYCEQVKQWARTTLQQMESVREQAR
jgi:hypothetical protein